MIGKEIVMPEPTVNDAWRFGNFIATIIDELDNGTIIVEDQDSDCWEIEKERVKFSESI